MSDALLNQGWDNTTPTPIFWETVRDVLFGEKPKVERPRDENGRFTKS